MCKKFWTPSRSKYRVFHQLADLGMYYDLGKVDLYLGVFHHLDRLLAQLFLPKSYLPKQNRAGSGSAKISQPNQGPWADGTPCKYSPSPLIILATYSHLWQSHLSSHRPPRLMWAGPRCGRLSRRRRSSSSLSSSWRPRRRPRRWGARTCRRSCRTQSTRPPPPCWPLDLSSWFWIKMLQDQGLRT